MRHYRRPMLSARTASASLPPLPVASEPKAEPCKTATNAPSVRRSETSSATAESASAAPHLETDWRAVAMFLAGVIVEEHPTFAQLILQVVEDYTKPVTTTAATGGGKEFTA